MTETIDNPILNSPYVQPDSYYEVGPQGPTGEIRVGRRPSESFIPIAMSKKGKGASQGEFNFDATGERRERNTLINDLRRDVERWRRDGQYPGVTPISRKLLQHWADPNRENRVLFCQREAAETAIFLTEVAGRKGVTDWRQRLEPENDAHNSGLPRVALKMATAPGLRKRYSDLNAAISAAAACLESAFIPSPDSSCAGSIRMVRGRAMGAPSTTLLGSSRLPGFCAISSPSTSTSSPAIQSYTSLLTTVFGNTTMNIMETFPIVKRKDIAAHGEYRSKRMILKIYDAMAEAENTGRPYRPSFEEATAE